MLDFDYDNRRYNFENRYAYNLALTYHRLHSDDPHYLSEKLSKCASLPADRMAALIFAISCLDSDGLNHFFCELFGLSKPQIAQLTAILTRMEG